MHPNKFAAAFVANLESEIKTPTTMEEALNCPQRAQWQAAMAAEMGSLQENQVYRLVPRPKGKKVMKSKWVFRIKFNADGSVEKYKAIIVAKGFSQVEGEDYDQTFSPTARFESICQLVAMGASRGLHMHQMDVTTTFLYAPLEEEVYMEASDGTCMPGEADLVWLLLKCLYGLKQAPRGCNQHIDDVLKGM